MATNKHNLSKRKKSNLKAYTSILNGVMENLLVIRAFEVMNEECIKKRW
jgi:hypothetical protein